MKRVVVSMARFVFNPTRLQLLRGRSSVHKILCGSNTELLLLSFPSFARIWSENLHYRLTINTNISTIPFRRPHRSGGLIYVSFVSTAMDNVVRHTQEYSRV